MKFAHFYIITVSTSRLWIRSAEVRGGGGGGGGNSVRRVETQQQFIQLNHMVPTSVG